MKILQNKLAKYFDGDMDAVRVALSSGFVDYIVSDVDLSKGGLLLIKDRKHHLDNTCRYLVISLPNGSGLTVI